LTRQQQCMCIVNREIVRDLASLVGKDADIMDCLGISRNSWIKIVAGLPVRRSMALRLRQRMLAQAASMEGLRNKFPSSSHQGGVDLSALERAFLQPAASKTCIKSVAFRSVRQAMAFGAENGSTIIDTQARR
jgi:hypothetical protein